jgi:hypothetical protein
MISYDLITEVFDLDNPLTLEYFELCSKNTDEPKYFEKHHILPRSLFPEFIKAKWNIVKLTYKDHYRAHEILPFICIQKHHIAKMSYAWAITCHTKDTSKFIDARLYEQLKILQKTPKSKETRAKISASCTGELNHNYNKKMSKETRSKMSASKDGEKHNMYGIPKSEKTRSKISSTLLLNHPKKGVKLSKEVCDNMSLWLSRYYYEQYSLEGVLVKRWESIKDIENNSNFLRSSISSVCSGKRKSHGGFIWRKTSKVITNEIYEQYRCYLEELGNV